MSLLSFKRGFRALVTGAAVIGATSVSYHSFLAFADEGGKPPAAGVKEEQPAMTVTVSRAVSERWPVMLSASGEIAPRMEASASAEAGGLRILEIFADVGDSVKKGKVLARMNTELLEAERDEVRAQLSSTESERKRALSLRGTGAVSAQEVENFTSQAEAARARLQSVSARIRYGEVTAPEDGIIISRSAVPGATVGSGTELFRLIVGGKLEWRAELTPAQAAAVSPGAKAVITLPDRSTAQATVRLIAPTADTRSRMTLLYADLSPGSSARAGYYASGEIQPKETDALSVPSESVVIRDGKRYVFVVGKDAVVTARAVAAGRRRGDRLEILQGLIAGELVAERGAGFLNDGDKVNIVSSPSAAGSAPATPSPAAVPASSVKPKASVRP